MTPRPDNANSLFLPANDTCEVVADTRSRTGQMYDPVDVLMAIISNLAPVAARAGQPDMLDVIFGLHIQVASV